MPLAPVDDNGTQLQYADSGAPADSNTYTTLVFVHGIIFHGVIFHPLFQYAAKHNMRMVTVNLREYPGSTPYSPAELDALKDGGADGQRPLIRGQGLELAAFLAWYIRAEGIPPIALSEEGDPVSGGIVLLGWSIGNTTTLSMFAHAPELAAETRDLLQIYLRVLVMYDPFYPVLGGPDRPKWRDPALENPQFSKFEDHAAATAFWATSYYKHSPSLLSSLADVDEAQLDAGIAAGPMQDPPAHQTPLCVRMTPAQLAGCTQPSVIPTLMYPICHVDRTIYDENLRRTLFDKTVWPHVRVELLWFDMSEGEFIRAAWYIQKVVAERAADARTFHARRMEGANHFPHWELPERTASLLAEIL